MPGPDAVGRGKEGKLYGQTAYSQQQLGLGNGRWHNPENQGNRK